MIAIKIKPRENYEWEIPDRFGDDQPILGPKKGHFDKSSVHLIEDDKLSNVILNLIFDSLSCKYLYLNVREYFDWRNSTSGYDKFILGRVYKNSKLDFSKIDNIVRGINRNDKLNNLIK